MIVITAPEPYERVSNDIYITCFLAGGITGCDAWQDQVISYLKEFEEDGFNLSRLVLFNPRRDNFDVTDKEETERQISWEHDRQFYDSDIVSFYFNDKTLQPIALYELGKYSEMMRNQYELDEINAHLIVSSEPGYRRKEDVYYQMKYAFCDGLYCDLEATPKRHAIRIHEAYITLRHLQLKDAIKDEERKKKGGVLVKDIDTFLPKSLKPNFDSMCNGCPFIDVSTETEQLYADNRIVQVKVEVSCNHIKACRWAYTKGLKDK